MEEHGIGTELAIFYKALMVMYERQRKFRKANEVLLQGRQKGAQPEKDLDFHLTGFEDRMEGRLKRDFFDKKKYLNDSDTIDIPAVYGAFDDEGTSCNGVDDNSQDYSFQNHDYSTDYWMGNDKNKL